MRRGLLGCGGCCACCACCACCERARSCACCVRWEGWHGPACSNSTILLSLLFLLIAAPSPLPAPACPAAGGSLALRLPGQLRIDGIMPGECCLACLPSSLQSKISRPPAPAAPTCHPLLCTGSTTLLPTAPAVPALPAVQWPSVWAWTASQPQTCPPARRPTPQSPLSTFQRTHTVTGCALCCCNARYTASGASSLLRGCPGGLEPALCPPLPSSALRCPPPAHPRACSPPVPPCTSSLLCRGSKRWLAS